MKLNAWRKKSFSVFPALNGFVLSVAALTCLLPVVNLLAVSLSGNAAATSGAVGLLPVDFTLDSYAMVIGNKDFWQAFLISVQRVFLAIIITTVMTTMVAYPLSQVSRKFKSRTFYAWFLFTPMLIQGGLIPWYFTLSSLGLVNSIWAFVIPGAVPVFNCFLLSNYIRQLPPALTEAAQIDGAGHTRVLVQIILPLCKPVLATLTLFTFVGNWNEWFQGLILMDTPSKYPLQTYLQVLNRDASSLLGGLTANIQQYINASSRSIKAAQIFVAIIPVAAVYPFLQKYFVKGIVIGSVKG